MGIRGEIFSSKVLTEKRTYFFNVKENRKGDLFMNVVESTKHGEDGFDRHSIMVYQEDIEEFFREFSKAVNYMKTPHKEDFRKDRFNDSSRGGRERESRDSYGYNDRRESYGHNERRDSRGYNNRRGEEERYSPKKERSYDTSSGNRGGERRSSFRKKSASGSERGGRDGSRVKKAPAGKKVVVTKKKTFEKRPDSGSDS